MLVKFRSILIQFKEFLAYVVVIKISGCIEVDEVNERLFLSDINHHRILVFDGNGKILDSVCKEFHLQLTFDRDRRKLLLIVPHLFRLDLLLDLRMENLNLLR